MSDKPTCPVCPYCGSPGVSVDAVAVWDRTANDWVLFGTFDSGDCAACDAELKRFNWVNTDDLPTRNAS